MQGRAANATYCRTSSGCKISVSVFCRGLWERDTSHSCAVSCELLSHNSTLLRLNADCAPGSTLELSNDEMSQASYNVLGQGPATIPMQYPGNQQRITLQPQPAQTWCTPRRTKVIIAIVILTLLWIATVIIWARVKYNADRKYTYSYNG